MSSTASDAKVFGRYHELLMMVIGFVLTTMLGGILTYWYQKQAWEREDLSKRKQEQILRASEAFEDISKLIDKRLFRLRIVLSNIEKNEVNKETEKIRDSYREIISEWNENLYRNLSKVEIHFGRDSREIFEKHIMPRFADLNLDLIAFNNRSGGKKAEDIKNGIEELRFKINDLNIKMLNRLQEGAVGSFGPKPPVESSTYVASTLNKDVENTLTVLMPNTKLPVRNSETLIKRNQLSASGVTNRDAAAHKDVKTRSSVRTPNAVLPAGNSATLTERDQPPASGVTDRDAAAHKDGTRSSVRTPNAVLPAGNSETLTGKNQPPTSNSVEHDKR